MGKDKGWLTVAVVSLILIIGVTFGFCQKADSQTLDDCDVTVEVRWLPVAEATKYSIEKKRNADADFVLVDSNRVVNHVVDPEDATKLMYSWKELKFNHEDQIVVRMEAGNDVGWSDYSNELAAVIPGFGFKLMYTETPRSGYADINGVSFSDQSVSIELLPKDCIQKVDFYLDDVLTKTEQTSPYDFLGYDADNNLKLLDMATLASGTHIAKAVVTLLDGRSHTVEVPFTKIGIVTQPPEHSIRIIWPDGTVKYYQEVTP